MIKTLDWGEGKLCDCGARAHKHLFIPVMFVLFISVQSSTPNLTVWYGKPRDARVPYGMRECSVLVEMKLSSLVF